MAVAALRGGTGAERVDVATTVRIGAVWGVIGALVMAMYAMAAGATYLGSGFFTPLYHIASTFIEPKPMMTSMQQAMSDQSTFYFSFGPAAVGMMVHLATGVAFGIFFALLGRVVGLRGFGAVIAGGLYGIAVMLFSSFVALPLAASAFGGGEPIRDMPQLVGWSTFSVEHLIFGLVLGVGWSIGTRDVADRTVAVPAGSRA